MGVFTVPLVRFREDLWEEDGNGKNICITFREKRKFSYNIRNIIKDRR